MVLNSLESRKSSQSIVSSRDLLARPCLVQAEPAKRKRVFKEDFNSDYDLNFYQCWCNYDVNIVNNAFRIKTNDKPANEWFSVFWLVNQIIKDSVQATTIDFSDPLFKPVLRIRAKASDTARIAFSLVDTSKSATAGITLNQISYFDVTTQYQVFEVDFSKLFFYEWDNPTSPVDSTKISSVQMTIYVFNLS